MRVPVSGGSFDRDAAEAAVTAFHDAHERLYGYCFRDKPSQQVEWVNLRVTGIGPITRPELPTLDKAPGDLRDRAVRGQRPVCFDPDDGYVDTPVIWRTDLGAGDTFSGPAIVEEFGSTIPVHPGFRAEVDRFGNVRVTREAS